MARKEVSRTLATISTSWQAICASACFFRYSFAVLDRRQPGSKDQVLDLHLALLALVRPWMIATGR